MASVHEAYRRAVVRRNIIPLKNKQTGEMEFRSKGGGGTQWASCNTVMGGGGADDKLTSPTGSGPSGRINAGTLLGAGILMTGFGGSAAIGITGAVSVGGGIAFTGIVVAGGTIAAGGIVGATMLPEAADIAGEAFLWWSDRLFGTEFLWARHHPAKPAEFTTFNKPCSGGEGGRQDTDEDYFHTGLPESTPEEVNAAVNEWQRQTNWVSNSDEIQD